MDENIQTINNIIFTLDSISIRGRITENAEAYNKIIACINSLSQLSAKLQEKPEDDTD